MVCESIICHVHNYHDFFVIIVFLVPIIITTKKILFLFFIDYFTTMLNRGIYNCIQAQVVR